jgi:hypothetical protein
MIVISVGLGDVGLPGQHSENRDGVIAELGNVVGKERLGGLVGDLAVAREDFRGVLNPASGAVICRALSNV